LALLSGLSDRVDTLFEVENKQELKVRLNFPLLAPIEIHSNLSHLKVTQNLKNLSIARIAHVHMYVCTDAEKIKYLKITQGGECICETNEEKGPPGGESEMYTLQTQSSTKHIGFDKNIK